MLHFFPRVKQGVGRSSGPFCKLILELLEAGPRTDPLSTLTVNFPMYDGVCRACKARAANLRVHFKNTREAAHVLRGMKLKTAQKYLQEVIEHKDIVPFKRHTGGIGRHAQVRA